MESTDVGKNVEQKKNFPTTGGSNSNLVSRPKLKMRNHS